jgi:hypothetical protein
MFLRGYLQVVKSVPYRNQPLKREFSVYGGGGELIYHDPNCFIPILIFIASWIHVSESYCTHKVSGILGRYSEYLGSVRIGNGQTSRLPEIPSLFVSLFFLKPPNRSASMQLTELADVIR